MSITDLSVVDTTPGGSGPFAPPSTTTDTKEYAYWLREQFATDRGFAQFMSIVCRREFRRSSFSPPPTYKGPLQGALREELRLLDKRLRDEKT